MTATTKAISKYAVLTAYSLALLTPGIWLLAVDWSLESSAKLLFSVIFLLAWHISFKSFSRAINYSLLFFTLLPLDVFFFYIYNEPPTTPVLLAMSESNLGEAADFMRGREVMLAGAITLSILIWLYASRVAQDVEGRIWRSANTPLRFLAKLFLASLVVTWILFVGTPVIERLALKKTMDASVSNQLKDVDARISIYFIRLKGTFPVGRLVSIGEYYREEMNFENSNIRKAEFLFHAEQINPPDGRQIHLLVIGETARGDHSQLNGYTRETNPILIKHTNVFPFSDIVTPWTFTNRSVPVMVTRTPGSFAGRTIDEKSIVGAFREAGFRTYWISNQQPIGLGETSITHFAREADEAIFLNTSGKVMMQSGNYDGQVLEPLQRILNKGEKKLFIVIHLLGSHDSYDKRHPPEFDFFKPSLSSLQFPDHHDVRNKTEVINSFDNSMRYTDFVLSKIIDIVDETHSIASLVYSSDHGETLFDGSCGRSGHGSSGRQEFPVSAMAWVSSSHKSYWPEKSAALASNSPKRITTENVFPSVVNLAGISSDQFDEARSLSSPKFQLQRRLVNASGLIDWDTATAKGPCNLLASH